MARNNPRSTMGAMPPVKDITDKMPNVADTPGLEEMVKVYRLGKCLIILGRSEEVGWHISISGPNRYPTWDEVSHARYTLIPDDINMAMMLPKKQDYVNVHDYCFHLWQMPDKPGV